MRNRGQGLINHARLWAVLDLHRPLPVNVNKLWGNEYHVFVARDLPTSMVDGLVNTTLLKRLKKTGGNADYRD